MNNITHYELTTIIDSNIPDNEHPAIIEKMKELIIKNKGEITLEDNLGRKKLSYPIKKLLKGVFICLEFNIEPKTIKTLEKELKLNKDIIRFLLIKKPENIAPLKTEDKSEKKDSLNSSQSSTLSNTEDKKDTANKTKDKNEDKKTNLNELDKKLDEILNDEIIN